MPRGLSPVAAVDGIAGRCSLWNRSRPESAGRGPRHMAFGLRQDVHRMTPLRLGLVGLDSSHAGQFAQRLHDPRHPTHVPGARIVAAWPGGSADLPLSHERVAGFTATLRDEYGVAILPSIAEVCAVVDAVLILSVDGRAHLAQAGEVVAAGRPFFLDKPVAATLSDAVALCRLAAEAGVAMFSASATRFWPAVVALATAAGPAPRCVFSSGPAPTLAHHSDLFFYGIHAAEALFTVMGRGCRSVSCTPTADVWIVSGCWDEGRVATLHAMRSLPLDSRDYAIARFDAGRAACHAGAGDYGPLLAAIVDFVRKGRPPVSVRDTLEIYAFLEAAVQSGRDGGRAVALRDVLERAACPADWLPEPARA